MEVINNNREGESKGMQYCPVQLLSSCYGNQKSKEGKGSSFYLLRMYLHIMCKHGGGNVGRKGHKDLV